MLLIIIFSEDISKVGSSFSDLLDILYGVSQSSILGPLLFNINLCDLFLYEYSSEFSNFADDTTPYEWGENYDEVINKLEGTIEKLFNWFKYNKFKANASKCLFFLSPHKPVKNKRICHRKFQKWRSSRRNNRQQIVIWWSHHNSMLQDKSETSCIIQGSKSYEFSQKKNYFKIIYYLTIQLFPISVNVS